MSRSSAAPRSAYHHGDLRNALLNEGVELAREGGPSAIVLREAARRAGVSPNATYSHFKSLPDLVVAVSEHAMSALARSMEHELDSRKRRRNRGDDAAEAFGALGRGYVLFALREPGLFRTAFETNVLPIGAHHGVGDSGLTPLALLERGLDEMVKVGRLSKAGRRRGVPIAWSTVHGLSMLLLGPYRDLSEAERDALIRDTVAMVVARP